MNAWGKRAVSLLAAGTLILGGLVGCGAQDPQNTQELLQRYEAAENHDNYHLDMDLGLSVSLLGQDFGVNAKLAMDHADGNAHGTMTMSILGEDSEAEMYVEKDGDAAVTYQSSPLGDGTWTKSETDLSSAVSELTSVDVLKDAQFAATEDGYELRIAGDKLISAFAAADSSSENSLLGESDVQEALDMLKDSEAVFVFDKNALLTEVDFDGILTVTPDETLGLSMDADLKLTATFSDYGNIDAATLAVPEDVKSAAEASADSAEDLSELLNIFGSDDEEDAKAA